MAEPSDLRIRVQTTIAASLAVLAWWVWRKPAFVVVGSAATAFALLAWLAPSWARVVHQRLAAIGRRLLQGLTWLLLGLVYFVVVTPLRLFRRLRREDPLHRRWQPEATSYFRPAPPFDRDHFRRQF